VRAVVDSDADDLARLDGMQQAQLIEVALRAVGGGEKLPRLGRRDEAAGNGCFDIADDLAFERTETDGPIGCLKTDCLYALVSSCVVSRSGPAIVSSYV
jgi:hypothetical protein